MEANPAGVDLLNMMILRFSESRDAGPGHGGFFFTSPPPPKTKKSARKGSSSAPAPPPMVLKLTGTYMTQGNKQCNLQFSCRDDPANPDSAWVTKPVRTAATPADARRVLDAYTAEHTQGPAAQGQGESTNLEIYASCPLGTLVTDADGNYISATAVLGPVLTGAGCTDVAEVDGAGRFVPEVEKLLALVLDMAPEQFTVWFAKDDSTTGQPPDTDAAAEALNALRSGDNRSPNSLPALPTMTNMNYGGFPGLGNAQALLGAGQAIASYLTSPDVQSALGPLITPGIASLLQSPQAAPAMAMAMLQPHLTAGFGGSGVAMGGNGGAGFRSNVAAAGAGVGAGRLPVGLQLLGNPEHLNTPSLNPANLIASLFPTVTPTPIAGMGGPPVGAVPPLPSIMEAPESARKHPPISAPPLAQESMDQIKHLLQRLEGTAPMIPGGPQAPRPGGGHNKSPIDSPLFPMITPTYAGAPTYTGAMGPPLQMPKHNLMRPNELKDEQIRAALQLLGHSNPTTGPHAAGSVVGAGSRAQVPPPQPGRESKRKLGGRFTTFETIDLDAFPVDNIEAFLDLSCVEFNKKIKTMVLSKDQIAELKKARRRKKNRSYAKTSRDRKATKLETKEQETSENEKLKQQLAAKEAEVNQLKQRMQAVAEEASEEPPAKRAKKED